MKILIFLISFASTLPQVQASPLTCSRFFTSENPYQIAESLARRQYNLRNNPAVFRDPILRQQTQSEMTKDLRDLGALGPAFIRRFHQRLADLSQHQDLETQERRRLEVENLESEVSAVEFEAVKEAIEIDQWSKAKTALKEHPNLNLKAYSQWITEKIKKFRAHGSTWTFFELSDFLNVLLKNPTYDFSGVDEDFLAVYLSRGNDYYGFETFYKKVFKNQFNVNLYALALANVRLDAVRFLQTLLTPEAKQALHEHLFETSLQKKESNLVEYFIRKENVEVSNEQFAKICALPDFKNHLSLIKDILVRPSIDRNYRDANGNSFSKIYHLTHPDPNKLRVKSRNTQRVELFFAEAGYQTQ